MVMFRAVNRVVAQSDLGASTMLRKILLRLTYLVFGGAIVLVFLIIAQVNLDDLRLKVGGLRSVPDSTIKVGGLYSIFETGQVAGPICVIDRALVESYTLEENAPVRISNKLGSSLPTVSRWTANLFGFFGTDEIAGLLDRTGATTKVDWKGHTLDVSKVSQKTVFSASTVPLLMDAMYLADPQCERTVQQLARAGQCVTMIFRVATIAGQKIGYKLANDRLCIIPNSSTVGIKMPAKPTRLTASLSNMKDRFGLLDHSIATGN